MGDDIPGLTSRSWRGIFGKQAWLEVGVTAKGRGLWWQGPEGKGPRAQCPAEVSWCLPPPRCLQALSWLALCGWTPPRQWEVGAWEKMWREIAAQGAANRFRPCSSPTARQADHKAWEPARRLQVGSLLLSPTQNWVILACGFMYGRSWYPNATAYSLYLETTASLVW